MYREYYKLSAEPFTLTVDPSLVSAHQSYHRAQGQMQLALEQGDGILVVTGRSGTGKTTLIEDFRSKLTHGEVLSATVVGAPLKTESVLRMAGYAFGLDAKNLDEATLLCELQGFLSRQAHARALLIIDEAHNLSAEALEEVRMLVNMHTGPGPLLQIFLVGQEQLHETLHTPQMQQLHQRIMATCTLEPLSLQEVHDYVLHRLHFSGWRGDPAIVSHTFVLIHRFSQGLPRYISKLCARLLVYGAQHKQHALSLDDVITIIDEMQKELLLPLSCESQSSASAPLPLLQDLINSKALPTASRINLTIDEQVFLDGCPSVIQSTPASVVLAAKQARKTVIRFTAGSEDSVGTDNSSAEPDTAGPQARELIRHFSRPSLVIMTQVSRSGARFLGQQLKRLIAGLRHLSSRSGGLGSAAQTLWDNFQDYGSRVWTTAVAAFSHHLEGLQKIAERVGRQKIIGYCSASLLILVGGYLLITDKDDQHREAVATMAATQSPVAHTDEQSPAPKADVNRQEPTPTPSPAPDVIELPEAEPGHTPDTEQASLAAATETGPVLTPDPAQGATAVAPVAEEEEVAETNRPAAASDESTPNVTEAHIEELLALADRALARDRLLVPKEQSAWYYYRQILAIDPGNQAAHAGLQRIAARYRELAVQVLQNQEFGKAERFIQRGLSVVADDSSLLALQDQVQRQRRELQVQREEEELLALRESAPAVDPQPKSSGLFGALKRVFTGNSANR